MKRSRINPFSKKTREKQAERKKLLDEHVRGKPCAARWSPICTGRATDGHEIKTRARGGSTLDKENVLPVCRNCHTLITTNPAEAHRRGLMKHSWED